MAASRFVEVSDEEISEIKMNSDQKNTKKTCAKILKQLFASGSVIIGEYSPRHRLGEYSPIITSPIIVKYYNIMDMRFQKGKRCRFVSFLLNFMLFRHSILRMLTENPPFSRKSDSPMDNLVLVNKIWNYARYLIFVFDILIFVDRTNSIYSWFFCG
jgi:hypothetical protein